MKTKIKLYWDMDGVLADWDERCLHHIGSSATYIRLDAEECAAIQALYSHHQEDLNLFKGMPWYHLVDEPELPLHLCDYMDTYCAPSEYNLAYRQARKNVRSFKDAALPHGFFKELRPFPMANYLLAVGQTIDPIPTILTAPMGEDADDQELRCRRDKFQWMAFHFADRYAFNFHCTKNKEVLATPEEGVVKVLIDDRFKNLKSWMNAGGIPILHKNAENTVALLTQLAAHYESQ